MIKKYNQAGFTLIEMAFVILIAGLLIGSFFAFYTPQLEQRRILETIQKENKIAQALSEYAQTQSSLPCPARPENLSSTQGTAPTTCVGAALRNGIVPYRTLGLTQDDVTDPYNNPISYTVSAALSVPPAPTTDLIHQDCKTAAWIPTTPTNINPNKADLCCRQATANKMEIFSDVALTTHIVPIQGDAVATGFATGANNATQQTTNADNLDYFAYALVGHGPNGEGSYVIGAAPRKLFVNAGNSEKINADNDTNDKFVVLNRSLGAGTSYFDDVVLWRTQKALIRETNSNSCSAP